MKKILNWLFPKIQRLDEWNPVLYEGKSYYPVYESRFPFFKGKPVSYKYTRTSRNPKPVDKLEYDNSKQS